MKQVWKSTQSLWLQMAICLFLHLVQKKLCKNPLLDCGGGRGVNIFACKFHALFYLKKTNNNQNGMPIIWYCSIPVSSYLFSTFFLFNKNIETVSLFSSTDFCFLRDELFICLFLNYFLLSKYLTFNNLFSFVIRLSLGLHWRFPLRIYFYLIPLYN